MNWTRVLQALGGLGILVSGVLTWYAFQRPICAMAGGSCSPNINFLLPAVAVALVSFALLGFVYWRGNETSSSTIA